MFEKFYQQFIRIAYIFGIGLLMVSLTHSKFAMSVSQFFLAGTFAVERINLKKAGAFFKNNSGIKLYLLCLPYFFSLLFASIYKGVQLFLKNKPALIFSSILLMHLIGLIFTSDFTYAFKDLRTKLPIFLLPLYISTSQAFGRRSFYYFMLLFCAAVIVRTLINTWGLYQDNYIDIRQISKSISHLRVALFVTLTIFSLGYLINKKRDFSVLLKIVFILLMAWLIIYLIITQSATGLIISGLTLILFLIIMVFKTRNRWIKAGLSLMIISFLAGTGYYLFSIIHDYYKVNPVDLSKLESYTSRGNRYLHNTKDLSTENGNYLWIYIKWDELHEAWNRRSKMSLDSVDKKNQVLLNTLTRFLTSKGERKDADAVEHLTNKEVKAIEKGVANVIFIEGFGIRGRIYEFFGGLEVYKRNGNPTGSTVMQRLEFWKASLQIIKENFWIGVGTGDMNEAFQIQYDKMHSKLSPDQRWRSHDQFLSIFVGFGIFGLIWFLFAIFYPPYMLGKFDDYFFLIFIIIAMISMIPEDTIESQAGVTFFAFFYSFLLWGRTEEDAF